MKRIILTAAMICLLVPGVSWAEDFDAGIYAYYAGEYETAYGIWLPMAEKGHARDGCGL